MNATASAVSHRRPTARSLCAGLLVLALSAVADQARAQDSVDPFPTIRETGFPESEPPKWPKGSWEPIDRDEYRRLLRSAQQALPGPRTTWIERAEYSATLDDDVLRDGRMTATVRRKTAERVLIPLDPLNLAISSLRWADGNAIWGATPDGRTALLVDRESARLQARWNFRGRRLPRSVEFDLRLAPATMSLLRLELPVGHVLKSSVGHVSEPMPAAQTGWNMWHIHLGSETRCRLTVSHVVEQTTAKAVLLAERDVSYVVRQEGLQFQADFRLEALKSPVEKLTFQIPTSVQIHSITLKDDESLAWTSKPAGDMRQIRVTLSEPVIGRIRGLRINGSGSIKLGSRWRLPQIQLGNALLLKGQLNLKVEAPLELRSFDATGLRQQSTDSDSEAERLSFHQYHPDGQLLINIGTPRSKLSAQVLTFVEVGTEIWSLTSEIEWKTQAGSTFIARCKTPPGWEITGVYIRSEDSVSTVNHWETWGGKGTANTLVVEFLDPIRPDEPKTIQIEAHRLPVLTQQPAILPVFQPLNTTVIQTVMAISHDQSNTPLIKTGSDFQTIGQDTLSEFVARSALWTLIRNDLEDDILWLQSKSKNPRGEVHFKSADAPYDAQADVRVRLEHGRLFERLSAKFTPGTAPVDRVLVYFAEQDSPLVWELAGQTGQRLSGRLLPKARHSNWNLPETGELWDVVLPTAQRRPFTIVGIRNRIFSQNFTVTLPYLPKSNDFRGTVGFNSGASRVVEFQTQGLRILEAETGSGDRTSATRSTAPTHQWHYSAVNASLKLNLPDAAMASSEKSYATLELHSLISSGPNTIDVHRARYVVGRQTGGGRFRFTLRAPAQLNSVHVNGSEVRPTSRDGRFELPVLADLPNNVIEIYYRTPSTENVLYTTSQVSTPQTALEILNFDWHIALPPNVRLARDPNSMSLLNRKPEINWHQRFLGPLGRPADVAKFNPFVGAAWRDLFASRSSSGNASDETKEPNAIPAGWTVWRATAPSLPGSLSIQICNESTARLLGWCGMLGCLLAGLLLRLFDASTRRIVAACWLAGCLVVAWLTPAVFALIAGGCLLGTLFAIVMPRRFVKWTNSRTPVDVKSTIGTTVSYPHVVGTASLLLAASILTFTATAQDTPPDAAETSSLRPDPINNLGREFEVFVPLDSAGRPSERLPVVYVPDGLIPTLKHLANSGLRSIPYLIASADYAAEIDEDNSAIVVVKYRVAVLDGTRTSQIVLPIEDVNLDVRSPCLVDGKPQPILRSPEAKGYLVELRQPDGSVPAVARKPTADAVSDNPGPSLQSPADTNEGPFGHRVRFHDVVLRLRKPVDSRDGVNGFKIGIPLVPASRFSAAFNRAYPFADVIGAQGEVSITEGGRVVDAVLGKIRRLEVVWSTIAERVRTPVELEADMFCLVEAYPNRLEFHYRVMYRVLGGAVNYVSWNIPQGFIVRKVGNERSLGYSLSTHAKNNSRLQIEFATPRKDDFTVNASFTMPLDPRSPPRIPAIDLLDGAGEEETVEVTLNQIAIATPPEFRLSRVDSPVENLTGVSPEMFLENWGGTAGLYKPQIAFQFSKPIEIPLSSTPVTVSRTVRANQVGVITNDRLHWTFNAEIKTSAPGAFHHILIVDPRLQIDKLSVLESEVDRMDRSSRVGKDRLILFLSDKTTGTQNILLEGSLPLEMDTETELPAIRVADAEVLESDLRLQRTSGVDVTAFEADAVEGLQETTDDSTTAARLHLVGRYRLDQPGDTPRIRVTTRSDRVSANSLILVRQQQAGRRKVETTLRFSGFAEAPEEFQIRIPAEFADDYRVQADNVERREESLPDGSLRLSLRPTISITGEFTVKIESQLDALQSDTLPIPRIAALNVDSGKHYLVFRSDGLELPASDRQARIDSSALPSWVSAAAEFDLETDRWNAMRYDGQTPTLIRKLANAESADARIPLIETRVWLNQPGRVFGCTTIYIVPRGEERLNVRWPDGHELRALLVDGRPGSRLPTEPELLSVPLSAAAPVCTVTICWLQKRPELESSFGNLSQELPLPQAVVVERSFVTIVPARGKQLRLGGEFPAIEPFDQRIEKLDGLLEMNRVHFATESRTTPLWRLLVGQYDQLRRQVDASEPPTDAFGPQLQQRLSVIGDDIEELRRSGIERQPEDGQAELSADLMPYRWGDYPQSPEDAVIRGRLATDQEPASISLFMFDSRIVNYALGAIAFVIAVWLLRKLITPQSADWLDEHYALTCAVLGMLWWALLSPGLPGLLLLLFAAVLAVRQPLRESGERESVLGEESQLASR